MLAAIPGAFGLFGLGHLYLGSYRRGFAFLGYSLMLYFLLAMSFNLTFSSSVLWVALPVLWFVGWVAGMYDVRKEAKRKSIGIREEAVLTNEIPFLRGGKNE